MVSNDTGIEDEDGEDDNDEDDAVRQSILNNQESPVKGPWCPLEII